MADVAMPRLSDSMEEGTILKWLKSDGDEVEKGEELVEIETDKANMTYEADESGTLSIVAKEGDTLAVGETICSIGEGGGSSGGAEDAEDEGEEDDSGDEEESEAEKDEEESEESEEEESEEDEREPVAEEETDDGEEDEGDGDEGEEKDGDGGGSEPAEEAEQEEEAEREPVATTEEDGDGDEAQETEPAPSGGNGRTKASPVARRMARELGVELAALEGTGPGGRIVKADVEAAAGDGKGAADEDGREPAEDEGEKAEARAKDEAGEDEASDDEGKDETAKDEGEPAEEKGEEAEAPTGKDDEKPKKQKDEQPAKAKSGDAGAGRGETTTEELTRLQQTVARRMAESKATAPDFVMTCEVDMEAAVAFRAQLKVAAGEDPAPSFNDFVVKASAFALRAFPRANGAYRDGRFELYSRVNVGIAVAGQDALVVPTIFDADRKSLGDIARDARGLAERVREGKITPPELAGGTFTVSNLGMYGIKRFVAVINPPQAAILAVGEMTPRPVVHDGEIVVRPLLELTLSCDHRILYGADAAQFLGHIRERLENPVGLAL
jgi:pyruvate dehydrogenase E2 component (dihydrolipoamide acetyltransferase)